MENIFNKLSMEHAVVETAFKHHFSEDAIYSKESPYQILYNEIDRIGLINESFTYLNGDKQSK